MVGDRRTAAAGRAAGAARGDGRVSGRAGGRRGSERRVLGSTGVGVAAAGGPRGPRVLGAALRGAVAPATATGVAAAEAATTTVAAAAEAAATAATARGLRDLGRGVAERRADLVDL